MFRKKKKENNINGYVEFIEKIIEDDEIKNEIIEKLEFFIDNGIVNIDGKNLTGKIIEEDANLYLDIKYEKGKFVCSYTKWDINSVVLIEQETLKSGNYKLTKTDKTKYYTYNRRNEYSTSVEEKIYNKDNVLLYESSNKIEEGFDSYKDRLVYTDDSPFKNMIRTEKYWYMPNGSIIMYSLYKNELFYKEEIQENYQICEQPYVSDDGCILKSFKPISRDLFISLMNGEKSIDEVLQEFSEPNCVKKKSSN